MFCRQALAAGARRFAPYAFGGGGCYVAASERVPQLPSNTVLEIDFRNVHLTEHNVSAQAQLAPQLMQSRDVLMALDAAGKDPNVSGIRAMYSTDLVLLSGSATIDEAYSWVNIEELNRGFERFREVYGKPSAFCCQSPRPSLQQLFLLSPFSYIEYRGSRKGEIPTGISSTQIYAGDMWQKHGVRFDVVKHGEFKAAPPLCTSGSTRSESSNHEAILASIYSTIVTSAAALSDRQHDPSPPSGVGISLHEYMAHLQKVNRTKDRQEYIKDLFIVSGNQAKYQAMCRQDPCDVFLDASQSMMKPKIPVVYIQGSMTADDEGIKAACLALLQISNDIDAGANIPHVILRINCPGGDTSCTDTVSALIKCLKVPVTASFGDHAASGGYWISTQADRIFSNETSITGSIGVYSVRPDLSRAAKRLGINIEHTVVGDANEHDNMLLPMSRQSKQALMEASAEIYKQFKQRVADGRGMSMDQVESIAQGRTYTGKQAKEIGLVDEIGGLQDAIDYVRKKHSMDNDVVVEYYPKPVPVTFGCLVNYWWGGQDGLSSSNVRMVASGLLPTSNVTNVASGLLPTALSLVGGLVSRIVDNKSWPQKASTMTLLVADEKTATEIVLKELGLDGIF